MLIHIMLAIEFETGSGAPLAIIDGANRSRNREGTATTG